MDTLASCYFCGAALDKRLQEYPVVPEALRGDDDVTTATLCPACHQKLDTVHDAVVEAIDDESVSGSATDETDTVADAPKTAASHDADSMVSGADTPESAAEHETDRDATATDDPVTADDVTSLAGDLDSDFFDDSDDEELQSAIEPDVPEHPEADTDERDPDGTDDDGDALAGDIDSSSLDDSDDDGDEGDRQSAMQADVPTEFQSDEGGADAAETDDPELSEADDAETAGTGEESPPGDLADAFGDSSADEPSSSSETAEQARTSVSALEYNKVMRLLQNREFPVDRDEIETVAANAYGLSQAECAEVIDLAIDRGLIGEDGDQLVRSE